MKLSKIDVLLADLRSERMWTEACSNRLMARGNDDPEEVLLGRIKVIDEIIGRIDPPNGEGQPEAPKRTRKRKAGLPEVEK